MDLRQAQNRQHEFDKEHWEQYGAGLRTELNHIKRHLGKAVGKLNTFLEATEHHAGAADELLFPIRDEVAPDLLIHALRMARVIDADAQDLYLGWFRVGTPALSSLQTDIRARDWVFEGISEDVTTRLADVELLVRNVMHYIDCRVNYRTQVLFLIHGALSLANVLDADIEQLFLAREAELLVRFGGQ